MTNESTPRDGAPKQPSWTLGVVAAAMTDYLMENPPPLREEGPDAIKRVTLDLNLLEMYLQRNGYTGAKSVPPAVKARMEERAAQAGMGATLRSVTGLEERIGWLEDSANERFEAMAKRFENVDEWMRQLMQVQANAEALVRRVLDGADALLEAVNTRFEAMTMRFEATEVSLGELASKTLDRQDARVNIDERLTKLEATSAELEAASSFQVDGVTALENRFAKAMKELVESIDLHRQRLGALDEWATQQVAKLEKASEGHANVTAVLARAVTKLNGGVL